MEVYRVNISNVALADMESIYNYIAKTLLAPESALRQYNRIANAILSLDTLRRGIRSLIWSLSILGG